MTESRTAAGDSGGSGPSLTHRVMSLLAIRPGEGRRALLAFLYLLFIIASYVLIKAVRTALFISEFGAMKLPYVMLGIAVLAGGFAAIYIRLARGRDTAKLVVWSLLFFASNILLFWWLALQGYSWLYPVLYIWSGVFGVIGPTQVWTLANELFTTREAKRLFGVVGAGGILGGLIGGSTAGLAGVIGSPQLLLIVAGFLLFAAAIVSVLAGMRQVTAPSPDGGKPPPHSLTESLKVIGSSSHLRLMAGLVFIAALATTSVDFQYSVMAGRAMDDPDQLTAFFGLVLGSISLVAFVLQLTMTSRLLALVGVGFVILLLPAALITGTLALFVTKSLGAAIFMKGSDGALKHSLDRSCRELMYLPVPHRIKLHAKSTIDTVMDRLGDGSAGALQLLITTGLGLGLPGSLAANFVLIGVWIFLALKLKREYVGQLRAALQQPRRSVVDVPLADADAREALEQVLRAGSDAERLGALEWVSTNAVKVDDGLLRELAHDSASAEVRRAALAVMLGSGEVEFPPELMEGLDREGHEVLVSAIDLVVEPDAAEGRQKLELLLDRAGETTRLTTVAYMLRQLGGEFEPFAQRVFEALLDPEAPLHGRCAAVRALALLPEESELRDRLEGLVGDSDLKVAAAAIETVGRSHRFDLLPRIVEQLAHPRLRPVARRSIESFGVLAVEPLVEALRDLERNPVVRRQVPRVLARLCTPQSVEALVSAMHDDDYEVRARAVDALYRMRGIHAELKPIDRAIVYDAVVARIRRHGDVVRAVRVLEAHARDRPERLWLLEALQEERARLLKRIFKLLGLGYPVHDIERAWLSVRYGSPVERANAIELLDNLLPKSKKGMVVALLEEFEGLRGRKGQPPLSVEATIRELVEWPNPWVAACAWYVARVDGLSGLETAAHGAGGSADTALREEARAFLASVGTGEGR